METFTDLASFLRGRHFKATRGQDCSMDLDGSRLTLHLNADASHSIEIEDLSVTIAVLSSGNETEYYYTIEVTNPSRTPICLQGDERVDITLVGCEWLDGGSVPFDEKYPWFRNHRGNLEWDGTLKL